MPAVKSKLEQLYEKQLANKKKAIDIISKDSYIEALEADNISLVQQVHNIQKDMEQRMALFEHEGLHTEQRIMTVESNNEMNEKKIDSSTDDISRLQSKVFTLTAHIDRNRDIHNQAIEEVSRILTKLKELPIYNQQKNMIEDICISLDTLTDYHAIN